MINTFLSILWLRIIRVIKNNQDLRLDTIAGCYTKVFSTKNNAENV